MLKVYCIMLKVEINNRILGVRFFEYISSRCKIASAQFCNKQITNTVSHNKKEQIPNGICSFLVRETGLEPVRVAPHAPQTCASADSATLASTL